MTYRAAPVRCERVITKAAGEIRRVIQKENPKAKDLLLPETQLSQ